VSPYFWSSDLPHSTFSTLQAQPLKTADVLSLMPRLAGKAGIEERVHFHEFHHTFSFDPVKEAVPMAAIQNALGTASG
jgi:integrase